MQAPARSVDRFNPNDWYWQVGEDPTQVFKSKTGKFVSVNDKDFKEWTEAGSLPSKIPSADDLYEVLKQQAPDVLKQSEVALEETGDLVPHQVWDVRIRSGLNLRFTGKDTLSGCYSIDRDHQLLIFGITAGIGAGKGLPKGADTVSIIDQQGNHHEFTEEEFLSFAVAVRDYVYDLNQSLTGNADWPDRDQTVGLTRPAKEKRT
jgi:hypothetical protein